MIAKEKEENMDIDSSVGAETNAGAYADSSTNAIADSSDADAANVGDNAGTESDAPTAEEEEELPIPSKQELLSCLVTLQSLITNNRQGFEVLSKKEQIELIKAAGIFSKPSKDALFSRKKQARKKKTSDRFERNNKARAKTGIRVARTTDVFIAPEQQQQFLLTNNIDGTEKSEGREGGGEGNEGNETTTEIQPELTSYRNCYVCKAKYTKLHFFYDTMCLNCGDLNYKKRFQRAHLENQVAVITGSRLKIGYHVTLMLLQSGATVIATTRFPADSALRFSKEKDYKEWCHRLHIHGLDLRHTPSVELFCMYIEQTYDRLDILINNAAQTVRRPPGYYAHMLEKEHLPFHQHPPEVQRLLTSHYKCLNIIAGRGSMDDDITNTALKTGSTTDYGDDDGITDVSALTTAVTWNTKGPGIGLRASAQLSQIPYSYDGSSEIQNSEVFPEGKLDVDLQQVDLRTTNSWRLQLGEISTMELLEVQLVNAVAPFVLCNRLSQMMKRDNTGCKHIVNVTAMEGKFYTFHKPSSRHPHTNMAKAALNMLTHTSSVELAKYGIYMNAVDTGWVTDEDPVQLATEKVKVHDFQPPLDIVDGAARVCDPFIDGINRGEHWCGKFMKDYFPIDW